MMDKKIKKKNDNNKIIREKDKITFNKYYYYYYRDVVRIWGKTLGKSQTIRHELTYNEMIPLSTQNLKELGLWASSESPSITNWHNFQPKTLRN